MGTKKFGEDMSTRVGRGVAAGEMPVEVLNPAARACRINASVGFADSKEHHWRGVSKGILSRQRSVLATISRVGSRGF